MSAGRRRAQYAGKGRAFSAGDHVHTFTPAGLERCHRPDRGCGRSLLLGEDQQIPAPPALEGEEIPAAVTVVASHLVPADGVRGPFWEPAP